MDLCLGGHDLEMLEIGELGRAQLGALHVHDRGLPWHAAKASAYRAEIESALSDGRTPVLVELQPDLPPDLLDRCRLVDHHGDLAGAARPTSLEQVFDLLGLPAAAWTRRHALVAANDRGWIPELRAMGASAAEIAAIRAEDRAAQGVAPAEEAAAARALAGREVVLGGSLLLVRLPHARTSPVFDALAQEALAGQPPDTLVVSPAELNFSGTGARVVALRETFAGGWSGGALPARGFWGKAEPVPPLPAVLAVLAGPNPALYPVDSSASR